MKLPKRSTLLRRLWRHLGREVTVLVVPHSTLTQKRLRFSLAFVVFLVLLWSGLTLWAGFLVGSHVDYWITKADNQLLRMKMAYFQKEFDRSRDILSLAQETDRQIRSLLAMRSRRAIIESEEAVGGPDSRDRADFDRALAAREEEGLSQPEFRRRALEIQTESHRRLRSFQEIAWYIAGQRSLFRATPNIWPASGRVTSGFGYRLSPFSGEGGGEFHSGIDVANIPETPIRVTADGVVRFAGWRSGYGYVVLVDHGFGFSTLYGHTSRVEVRARQKVRRGQIIASMGTTGRSTAEHLHYEVWRDGRPVDPRKFLTGKPDDPALRNAGEQ